LSEGKQRQFNLVKCLSNRRNNLVNSRLWRKGGLPSQLNQKPS
jgi:hypothetical protein